MLSRICYNAHDIYDHRFSLRLAFIAATGWLTLIKVAAGQCQTYTCSTFKLSTGIKCSVFHVRFCLQAPAHENSARCMSCDASDLCSQWHTLHASKQLCSSQSGLSPLAFAFVLVCGSLSLSRCLPLSLSICLSLCLALFPPILSPLPQLTNIMHQLHRVHDLPCKLRTLENTRIPRPSNIP